MSSNEDPLAGLLGSVRRQKTQPELDLSRSDKPEGEKGLNPLDLLGLPPIQRDLVNYLSRQKQASMLDIQRRLNRPEAEVVQVIADLKAAGYIHEALVDGQIYYRVMFGGKVSRSGRGVPQDIWNAVDLDNTVFLKQVALFSSLTDDQRNEIASRMTSRRYNRNEVIIWQGDVGDGVYFIKNGIVGISRLTPGSGNQEAETLAYLKQGDILGEHNLLAELNYSASATATALSEVELLVMKRQDFLSLLLDYENTALELARMLSERLVAVNSRLSSKGAETKLSLIVGIGESDTSIIGSTLAMILADMTNRKAAFTEHPNPKRLPELFGFVAEDEIHEHAAGYDIAMIEGSPGLPATVRTTLVMDRLLNDYSNIVIGLPGNLDEDTAYMLEKANQVVIITPPDQTSWAKLNETLSQLKATIHPERTSILIVVDRQSEAARDLPLPGTADYELPYLPHLPPPSDHTLDTIPEPLKHIGSMLADRLGRTNQIGIYIPTTTDVDQVVDTSGYIQQTMTFLGEVFGGVSATSNEAHGVWNSEDVGLVSETIHIVRTFVTQAELDRYLGDVLEYVEDLKGELKQEAMALEVNQKLMLI